LKEQTNQDIDKIFGIKFDNDTLPGGNKLHMSPTIGKPTNVDQLKQQLSQGGGTDYLNSSIGFLNKKGGQQDNSSSIH
jgi:hypothetical protein